MLSITMNSVNVEVMYDKLYNQSNSVALMPVLQRTGVNVVRMLV